MLSRIISLSCSWMENVSSGLIGGTVPLAKIRKSLFILDTLDVSEILREIIPIAAGLGSGGSLGIQDELTKFLK